MDSFQQPPQPNPYEFIVNPAQPPKKSFLSGGSLRNKLILIVGGALLLMALLAIVTVIFTGGSGNTAKLKALAAQQQELTRVADLGLQKAKDTGTRSLAITAKLSVATQQQLLIAYLRDRGTDLKRNELDAKKDSDIDKALEAAASTNRIDDAIREELDKQLRAYAQALEEVYDEVSNERGKAVLAASYSSTTLLLGSAQP